MKRTRERIDTRDVCPHCVDSEGFPIELDDGVVCPCCGEWFEEL